MRIISYANIFKLSTGIQQVLLQMIKDGHEPLYPIARWNASLAESKQVPLSEAKKVTERILKMGIIRADKSSYYFTL